MKRTEQKFDSKTKELKVQHNQFEQKIESSLSMEKVISSPVSKLPRKSTSKDVSASGYFLSIDPEKKANPHVSAYNKIDFNFAHVPLGRPEPTVSALPLASNKEGI